MKGNIGWYVVKIDNPDDAPRIAKAIDEEFANSPYETKTDTESAFAAHWVKQFGNIEFLIMTIGTVVFFTLLLVTGNTMAISVRERTSELAVLKAIGFSDRLVLAFVLGESMVIALVGGAFGLAACSVGARPSLAVRLSGMLARAGSVARNPPDRVSHCNCRGFCQRLASRPWRHAYARG